MSRAFPKGDLQDMAWGDTPEGYEVMVNMIVDSSRWATQHSLVFRHGDRFFETIYSQGATEQQDESPFECDPEMIECVEVYPVTETITTYKQVEEETPHYEVA